MPIEIINGVDNPAIATGDTGSTSQFNIDDFFASIEATDDSADKSHEEIIKDVLATGKAKLLKLHIKAIRYYAENKLYSITVMEPIYADVDSGERDALGEPIYSIGKAYNFAISTYSLAGTMRQDFELSLFADRVASPSETQDEQLANILLGGSEIEVLQQIALKGEDYSNPFAKNAKPYRCTRNRVFYSPVKCQFGPLGKTKLNLLLSK